ncbi:MULTISPECIES: cytochrome c [Paraburkholderia]|uniref:Cytochrome c n=1 Tax=Paraburkholderia madseniana TaxID=2599607 RepID=A0AAP5B7X0_9BURK|nr:MULTISPECIES: cytochrome c [Paraburkholderia]MCX4143942.1 cytochrome c [Paraburkholderia madseniana]MDN7146896.1 cytochrome c [Paraburkholderia sp. WS6]MDQ6405776.1 cytochrome c [Paraburkholderia madseniana]
MTKNTSRVQPADALVQRARRQHFRVATLAAVFSLFALYVAWHEAHGPIARHNDELPITQAHADNAAQPDKAAATSMAATSSDLVKRGEYLARAGDCVACHTADKARPFAGGLPINTPFGTIVTPNITPDPDTGIGQWSDTDFLRAMHEGVGKSGERLYPAFPYAEYTKVTDQDVLAIRAYLNTLTPIHYAPPSNSLKFPFNLRWLMVFWNLFNFDEGRFVPDPKQSAEWNRGAYLVRGLAHCEECHTPRNFTQGLKTSSRFSGAVQAGWHAYNITSDKNSGVGNWSDDELVAYLSTGAAPGRANAAGPMAEVVTDSTQYLTHEDVRSIVTYLRSVPPINGGESRPRDQWGNPAVDDVTALRGTKINAVNGAQLFIANCATCHNWTGQGVGASAPGAYPSLIHNSAVGASDANNLAMVILHGVSRTTKQADVLMPEFGTQLTDDQVAAITNYVTKQFGNPQSTVTVDQVAKLRAQQ